MLLTIGLITVGTLGLAATPITQRDRWVASPWLVALAERPEELAATLAEHLPEATSSMLVQADLTAVVAANGRAQALSEAERAAAAEQGREQRRRFLTPGVGYQPGNARMFGNGNN